MQYAIAKGEIITVSVMLYELSHWWKLMLPATFAPQDYFHRVCFTSCTCRYSYNVQYSDWRHYMLSQVFFVIQREPLLAAWLRRYFGSRQILVWSAGNQEGPYNAWWRIADDPVADLSGRKFRRLSVRPSVRMPASTISSRLDRTRHRFTSRADNVGHHSTPSQKPAAKNLHPSLHRLRRCEDSRNSSRLTGQKSAISRAQSCSDNSIYIHQNGILSERILCRNEFLSLTIDVINVCNVYNFFK